MYVSDTVLLCDMYGRIWAIAFAIMLIIDAMSILPLVLLKKYYIVPDSLCHACLTETPTHFFCVFSFFLVCLETIDG